MKHLTDTINEGLIDGFKIRKMITQAQHDVIELVDELIEKNPKKYRNGQQVMDAVKLEAFDIYKKTVNHPDAISVDEWWKKFAKANAHVLDMTTFSI